LDVPLNKLFSSSSLPSIPCAVCSVLIAISLFHSRCSSLVVQGGILYRQFLSLRDSTVQRRWLRFVLLHAGLLSRKFVQMPRVVLQVSQACRLHSELPHVLPVPNQAPCGTHCQQGL
jgi:hypothetical protein